MSHVNHAAPCSRRRPNRHRAAGARLTAAAAAALGAERADQLAAHAEELSQGARAGADVGAELAQLADNLGALHCLLDEAAQEGTAR